MTVRTRFVALGAMIALCLAPLGAVVGAVPWLAAETLDEVTDPAYAGSPLVAFGANGTAYAVWSEFDGVPTATEDGTHYVRSARRLPGGAWTGYGTVWSIANNFNQPINLTDLDVDDKGNLIVAWYQRHPAYYEARASGRRAGAAGWWAQPQDLNTAALSDAYDVQVEFDPAGNAVLVWTELLTNPAHVEQIVGRVRSASGTWSAVDKVSTTGATAVYYPSLAVDALGRGTALWTEKTGSFSRVVAATRSAGGAWSNGTPVSPDDSNAEYPQVALDAAGNATAVWGQASGAIRTARRPVGGAWGGLKDLATAGGNARVAVAPNGQATAIFNAPDPSTDCSGSPCSRVQARVRTGGTWGGATPLSSSTDHAYAPALAVDGRGVVTASWDSQSGPASMTRRTPTGAWSGATEIEPATADPSGPMLVADLQGNVLLGWNHAAASAGRVRARILDAAGPVSTVKKPTAWAQRALSMSVAWAARDRWSNVANHDVRYRSIGWLKTQQYTVQVGWKSASTATSGSLALKAGRTYCLSSRARDSLSNIGAWSAERCTTTPVDDRTLVAGRGWSRVRGTGDYLSTYTASTRQGATLTLTGAKAKRVGLLVTTLPGGGTVQFSFAGARLGTFRLSSATARHRQLIPIRLFAAARTGTLVITVVSSGKPVRIDGVVLAR